MTSNRKDYSVSMDDEDVYYLQRRYPGYSVRDALGKLIMTWTIDQKHTLAAAQNEQAKVPARLGVIETALAALLDVQTAAPTKVGNPRGDSEGDHGQDAVSWDAMVAYVGGIDAADDAALQGLAQRVSALERRSFEGLKSMTDDTRARIDALPSMKKAEPPTLEYLLAELKKHYSTDIAELMTQVAEYEAKLNKDE